jgi:hypothetical protein
MYRQNCVLEVGLGWPNPILKTENFLYGSSKVRGAMGKIKTMAGVIIAPGCPGKCGRVRGRGQVGLSKTLCRKWFYLRGRFEILGDYGKFGEPGTWLAGLRLQKPEPD